MYALPVNLDQRPECVPPLGHWRVMDRERWDSVSATFVSDHDCLTAAMDQLRLVRYPLTRVIINDMGVEVATHSPGVRGVPKAGSES